MATLLSLSYELHSQILSYLDPVHSMCLGLACKHLYAIHASIYKTPPLPLNAFTYECPIPSTDLSTICFLFTHLETWKPPTLKYCGGCHKFCLTSKHTGQARQRCDRCISNRVDYSDWTHLREPPSDCVWEDQADPARLPQYESSIDPFNTFLHPYLHHIGNGGDGRNYAE